MGFWGSLLIWGCCLFFILIDSLHCCLLFLKHKYYVEVIVYLKCVLKSETTLIVYAQNHLEQ